MSLDIGEEALTPAALSEHAAIPRAFLAGQILEVRLLDGGPGGISVTQTPVTGPHLKDYDAVEGAGPRRLISSIACAPAMGGSEPGRPC